MSTAEGYVVDKKGKPISLIIKIRDYCKILEELEEFEAIRACDSAKKSRYEGILLWLAVRQMERCRR